MSRSYKYPIYKDEADKRAKRLANKRIRKWFKTQEVGFKSNRIGKLLTNPYDISDYKITDHDGRANRK